VPAGCKGGGEKKVPRTAPVGKKKINKCRKKSLGVLKGNYQGDSNVTKDRKKRKKPGRPHKKGKRRKPRARGGPSSKAYQGACQGGGERKRGEKKTNPRPVPKKKKKKGGIVVMNVAEPQRRSALKHIVREGRQRNDEKERTPFPLVARVANVERNGPSR